MLNNIKISQTTDEIILNVNIVAEIEEIADELQAKIVKLKEFYKSAKTPIWFAIRFIRSSCNKKNISNRNGC